MRPGSAQPAGGSVSPWRLRIAPIVDGEGHASGLLALEKGMQLAFAPGRPLRSQGEDGGLLVGADGVGLM